LNKKSSALLIFSTIRFLDISDWGREKSGGRWGKAVSARAAIEIIPNRNSGRGQNR
jgi:hypothetical protein